MTVIAISPSRGVLPLDVILSEKHYSEIEITQQPIETGADVADHAYLKPKELTLEAASGAAAAVYAEIVRLQESRKPFDLVTGLYVYKDLLIKSVQADRDDSTGRILSCKLDLRQIITVSTSYTPSSVRRRQNAPNASGTSSANRATGGEQSASGASSNSTAAPTPKPETSAADTKDRASQTTSRGDAVEREAEPSILYGLLN